MTEPPAPAPQRSAGSWLHYLLAFSGFALFALALMSGKIDRRQKKIKQQFHGIQEIQRRTAGVDADDGLVTPEQRPALITMRPLMFLLGGVLLVAWLALYLRRGPATAVRSTPRAE